MSDLTTQVLVQIRDEVRRTNGRIDALDERLSGRIDSLDQRLSHFERRFTEFQVRLTTELTEVSGALQRLTDVISDTRHLEAIVARVQDHERRLTGLETP